MNEEYERLVGEILETLYKRGLVTHIEKVELCDPVVTVGEDYTITVNLASMFKNFSHKTQELMYIAINNLDINDIIKFNYNNENYIESITTKGRTIRMDLKTKQRDEKQWDKLYNFMDENDFSCQDFMSCVCATLLKYKENKFNTTIMLGDVKFDIEINKK